MTAATRLCFLTSVVWSGPLDVEMAFFCGGLHDFLADPFFRLVLFHCLQHPRTRLRVEWLGDFGTMATVGGIVLMFGRMSVAELLQSLLRKSAVCLG